MIAARFSWLVIFLLAWGDVARAIEPVRFENSIYENFTLRYRKTPNHPRERYSIYVIRGFDYTPWYSSENEELAKLLDPYLAPWDRDRFRSPTGNRQRPYMETLIGDIQKEAELLRAFNREFVWENYQARGPFDSSTKPPLLRGVRALSNHAVLTIMVTQFQNPDKIYETLSLGYDRGNGFPSQVRLRAHLPPLRHPIGPRRGQIRYLAIDDAGRLREFPEISKALSGREYIEGYPLEFRARVRATKPPLAADTGTPRDFMPILMSLLVANQYTLFSPVNIPAKIPRRVMSATERAEMDALKARYPFISDQLLYPEKQVYPLTSFIYNHSFGPARRKIFHEKFAFDYFTDPFPDPHQNALSSVGRLHREGLENDLLGLMAERPDYALVKEGVIRWHGGLPPFRESMLCPGFVLGHTRLAPNNARDYLDEIIARDEMPDYSLDFDDVPNPPE